MTTTIIENDSMREVYVELISIDSDWEEYAERIADYLFDKYHNGIDKDYPDGYDCGENPAPSDEEMRNASIEYIEDMCYTEELESVIGDLMEENGVDDISQFILGNTTYTESYSLEYREYNGTHVLVVSIQSRD